MAARRSSSPVNGSQELAFGVLSAAAVTGTASGGRGRSVSRFSSRSTGQRAVTRSAAWATRSMPNPCTPAIRSAGLTPLVVIAGYYSEQVTDSPAARIAANLRRLRERGGLSVVALAERSG